MAASTPRDLYSPSTFNIDVNGVNIEYEKVGFGPEPFLFLHGAGGDGKSYHPLLSRLPLSRLTIYAPTHRGCGASGKPGHGYNVPDLADEALAFADLLGLKQFHVSGHSLGGGMAMCLAALYPERVLSAIFIVPGPSKGFRQEVIDFYRTVVDSFCTQTREQIRATWLDMMSWYIPENELQGMIDTVSLTAPEYFKEITLSNGARVDGLKHELPEKLKDITAPTIMITGDKDRHLPYNLEDFQAIPGCELQVFANSNHALPIERTDDVARVMVDFLERVARRRLLKASISTVE